jgi:hypothetical protein
MRTWLNDARGAQLGHPGRRLGLGIFLARRPEMVRIGRNRSGVMKDGEPSHPTASAPRVERPLARPFA